MIVQKKTQCYISSFAKRDTSLTKIHKFDPSVRRQQDVIAFDVTVDGLVDMQVLEAL